MKTQFNVLMGCIVFMFIYMIYGAFLSLYPFKTLRINSVKVNTPIVKVGDSLSYSVDFCRLTAKPASVIKTLRAADESIAFNIYTDPNPKVAPIGCRVTTVEVPILPGTPAGEYYLFSDVDFQMSTQRDMHVQFKTPNFEITQ